MFSCVSHSVFFLCISHVLYWKSIGGRSDVDPNYYFLGQIYRGRSEVDPNYYLFGPFFAQLDSIGFGAAKFND